jgi:succinoglycan biosynthesis protein ExoU
MAPAAHACVIIAAKDASRTIGRAVRSALAEDEVSEVVVVDDGSADTTAEVALAAEDGTGRLKVLRLGRNRGPAFARNHAIAHSTSPLIAILDADDFFLPGRFRRLLDQPDWDLIADNIVFLAEDQADAFSPGDFQPSPRLLGLVEFIDGNISRRRVKRGEIGFLKPVIRRDFLERTGLDYRPDMRLGEDYDFYARALARGARYKLIHSCGYGAIMRADSLSGTHRTEDLKRLYEADRSMLLSEKLGEDAAAAIRRHERHVRRRYELRRFLDVKSGSGLFGAGLHGLRHPQALPAIVAGVALDKLDTLRSHTVQPGIPSRPIRYLLAATPIAGVPDEIGR